MAKSSHTQLTGAPLRQQTLSVEDAGKVLGISRSSAFQAVASGQLPVIRIGKRMLVSRHILEQMLGGPLESHPTEWPQASADNNTSATPSSDVVAPTFKAR